MGQKCNKKSFEDINNKLCANPIVQPYSLQRKATVTTDASEKAGGGVHNINYVYNI